MAQTRKKQIVRVLRVVMPLVGLAIAWHFTGTMARAWLAPLPDTLQGQAEKAVGLGIDGIIVYVDQAGRPPQQAAAGWKNKAARVPADPDCLFKIASISKLYVAAATVKLVAAGKLSLDAVLTDFFPELKDGIAYADQITLRQLLAHRSGIPNYSERKGYDWLHPPADNAVALQMVLGQPADFAPGTDYHYSNTNFLLIGNILDQTLGYSHRQFIQNEILEPLGLKHTYGQMRDVPDLGDLSSGYDAAFTQDMKDIDYTRPGGAMVATAQDVARFVRAMHDGSCFTPAEQALYTECYPYDHTGLLPGYQSIVTYDAELDAVVVQFVNTSGANFWPLSEIIYTRMLKILHKQAAGQEKV